MFDFDIEVKPILEVLVGKTIEQALMEVMEEEELANLRAQQVSFNRIFVVSNPVSESSTTQQPLNHNSYVNSDISIYMLCKSIQFLKILTSNNITEAIRRITTC